MENQKIGKTILVFYGAIVVYNFLTNTSTFPLLEKIRDAFLETNTSTIYILSRIPPNWSGLIYQYLGDTGLALVSTIIQFSVLYFGVSWIGKIRRK